MGITTSAVTLTGTPVVKPTHDEVTSSSARLDTAVRAKNWDAVEVELNNMSDLLTRDGGSQLTDEERRHISLVLTNAYAAADKANEWSIWQIILSIFALGIPGIVDAATSNSHERVHDKLKSWSGKSRFEIVKD